MFDNFLKEKSDFLSKKDKSKKGCIDKDALKIVNEINSKKGYYTTSSCSGRIVLLEMKSKKKNESNWIFIKHDKVNFKEILNSLTQCNKKNNQKNRELPLKAIVGLSEAKPTRCQRTLPLEETSFDRNRFKHQIWFKQQPLILHVACRNLDTAKKLLNATRKIFRRAGIIGVTKRKVMVEVIGDERLETIIADKNFVADENYLKKLIKVANENFVENKMRSEKFLKIIKHL